MIAKCPFCGKVWEVETWSLLTAIAREHLVKPGPCSDQLMARIVGIVDGKSDKEV